MGAGEKKKAGKFNANSYCIRAQNALLLSDVFFIESFCIFTLKCATVLFVMTCKFMLRVSVNGKSAKAKKTHTHSKNRQCSLNLRPFRLIRGNIKVLRFLGHHLNFIVENLAMKRNCRPFFPLSRNLLLLLLLPLHNSLFHLPFFSLCRVVLSTPSRAQKYFTGFWCTYGEKRDVICVLCTFLQHTSTI